MKTAVIYLLLSLMIGFCSCSSDTVSTNGNPTSTHRMMISPDSLHGDLFTPYSFKARVDGIASSDVRFEWLWGDSVITNNGNADKPLQNHEFQKTGKYSLTVKGYDYFTDTLIAQDSIPITIDSPLVKINIYPRSVDTIIVRGTDGRLIPPYIYFQFETVFPTGGLKTTFHLVGEGIDSVCSPQHNSFELIVNGAGIYTLSMEVFKQDGSLFGRDTAHIRLRFPTVNDSLINSLKSVVVKFHPDPNSSFVKSLGAPPELSIALGLLNNSTNHYSLVGNDFSVSYNATADAPDNFSRKNDAITGSFSADHTGIPTLSVAVDDSTYSGMLSKQTRWGFTLSNLKLIAVGSTFVTYAAYDKPMSDFSSNMYFGLKNVNYGACEDPSIIAIHIDSENLPIPNATVTFYK